MTPRGTICPAAEATSSVAYASWGQRLVAWLIDTAIIWGPVIGIAIAITESSDPTFIGVYPLLFGPIYSALLHATRLGQTVGKRIVGVAVRDASTLGRLSLSRSLGRSYIKLAFLVVLYIPWIVDALSPLWGKRNQSFHDKVAGSVVVRV